MVVDYNALAPYGLFTALGILMTITITISYEIFYKWIIQKENEIKNKVNNDVTSKIDEFQNTNPNLQDEQKFADEIKRIAKFKELFEDSKTTFEREIIISGIILVILGIVFIVWDKKDTIFVVGVIVLIIHLIFWNNLRTNKKNFERFLRDEDPREILGEL